MSNRDDVDTVRSRTDILQVVAPYVALKRAGRVWKGLCPFHNEKTPSFQVNPDHGRWHCFGQCSEGGDAFTFLQKVDNLTFPEALERLALKAGVTLTKDPSFSRDTVPTSERDRLYAAMNTAVRYYQYSLQQSESAIAYLSGRGIQLETIALYQLGYAGGEWDTLPRYLDQAGVTRDDAVRAGILVASERGGHYDKLRGRIVFPIVDVQNRTVAFGGRLTQADPDRPKYLNSAETPLFSKSKTLYGLSRARKAITDLGEAIVVEGYLDVITCHQAGFMNVVATLGTSLTEEHAVIIRRLASRVLLAFDSDAAGVKAAQRANAIFEAQEMEVRILNMPPGEDPDSLINSGRADSFQNAITDAVPVNEYRLRQILDQVPPGMPERERVTLIQREILPILRATKSVIERERYVRMAAPMHPFYATGSAMAEEQIREEVGGRKPAPPPARQYSNNRPDGKGSSRQEYTREYKKPIGAMQPRIRVLSGLETAEEIIVQALSEASDPEQLALLSELLKPELMVRPVLAKLTQHLLENPGADGIQRALDDPELAQDPLMVEIVMGGRDPIPGVTLDVLRDSIHTLQRHHEDQTLLKLRELSIAGNLQANELYTKIMRERKGARLDQKLNV